MPSEPKEMSEMKIQVVHFDKQIEVLSLISPAIRFASSIGGQGVISSATGMDHFFTSEGIYDGYGMNVSLSEEAVVPFMEAIENDREILDEKRQ